MYFHKEIPQHGLMFKDKFYSKLTVQMNGFKSCNNIMSQISTEAKFVVFRALFDIVQDDAGPPIWVWRESSEKKIQVDIQQVNFKLGNF